MNFRNRINKIEKSLNEQKNIFDNTAEVPAGVWYKDSEGKVIPGSGETRRTPRDEINCIGVLLIPAPMSKTEWQESARKQQQQKQPEIEFCSNCGSYLSPESGSYEIGEDGIAKVVCNNCLR